MCFHSDWQPVKNECNAISSPIIQVIEVAEKDLDQYLAHISHVLHVPALEKLAIQYNNQLVL
jgi:hypothetical protein